MRYKEAEPISRREAEVAFSSGSPERISDALVSAAFFDPDWRWVQDICIQYANHSDLQISGMAVTCFGHLARIHGNLEMERVLPILQKLRKDPKLAGKVDDALDDINMYIHDEPSPS